MNHDLRSYRIALDDFLKAIEGEQTDGIIAAQDKLCRSFFRLPFYDRFASEESSPITCARDLFDEKELNVLVSYISGISNLVEGIVRARDDIQFVQERCAWFLNLMMAN